MSPEAVLTLVTGSAGALVVLCVNVWALARGWVIPKPAHDAERERNTLLEKENAELNDSVAALRTQNAELMAKMARLEERAVGLGEKINALEKELASLRGNRA